MFYKLIRGRNVGKAVLFHRAYEFSVLLVGAKRLVIIELRPVHRQAAPTLSRGLKQIRLAARVVLPRRLPD